MPTNFPVIYSVEVHPNVTGNGTHRYNLPTMGGSAVVITGDHFGSDDRVDDRLVVTYGPDGTGPYEAVSCIMTEVGGWDEKGS